MKCVVTGGCGFIGSHLVDGLIARGDDVSVVDDLATGDVTDLNSAATFVRGSVLDAEVLDEAIVGADCVFHLAALPRVPRSIEDPVGTHLVNVDGTLNVLDAARRAGVKRVVYSSSSSTYGEQATHLMSEDMAPNPLSPYALQKLIGEQYAAMFASLYGTTVVSLRYFNVYGPRQPFEGAYALVIGKFLSLRRSGRPLTIYGDGEQTRAYSHVDDVVKANLLAAETELPSGQDTVLNIGTSEETSVNEIARMVGGEVCYVTPNPRGDMEEQRKAADYSRAKSVLGWEPTISLGEGLEALKDMG
jgi:UDP-glucose 4-epimerase